MDIDTKPSSRRRPAKQSSRRRPADGVQQKAAKAYRRPSNAMMEGAEFGSDEEDDAIATTRKSEPGLTDVVAAKKKKKKFAPSLRRRKGDAANKKKKKRASDPGLHEADGIGVAAGSVARGVKSDPGLSEANAGIAARKGTSGPGLSEADGTGIVATEIKSDPDLSEAHAGIAARKGTSGPGLSEADGTGIVGDALLGFKILGWQHAEAGSSEATRFHGLTLLKNGRFSKIYGAIDRNDGSNVVLKHYDTFAWGAVLSEVMFLERCRHPHVVQLLDVVGRSYGCLSIAFKFAGQPLHSHRETMKSWGGAEKAVIMKQVLTALAFLHEQFVIHRDVRPANILMQTNPIHVVVSDFSQCKISLPGFIARPWCEQAAATLTYTAPELLLRCNSIDHSVDLWSFGCVLAELLLGTPLFSGQNNRGALKCIRKLLGSPSVEDVSIMQYYPAWQPQLASPLPCSFSRSGSTDSSTEDGWDLVWKLLQWSPGRPQTLSSPQQHAQRIRSPPSHHVMESCFGVWVICNMMLSDVP